MENSRAPFPSKFGLAQTEWALLRSSCPTYSADVAGSVLSSVSDEGLSPSWVVLDRTVVCSCLHCGAGALTGIFRR